MGFTITNTGANTGARAQGEEPVFDPTESIVPGAPTSQAASIGNHTVAPVAYGVVGDFVRPNPDNTLSSEHTSKQRPNVQYGTPIVPEGHAATAQQKGYEPSEHWFREKRKVLDLHERKYAQEDYGNPAPGKPYGDPEPPATATREVRYAEAPFAPAEAYEPSLCDSDSRYVEATNLLPTRMLLYPFDRVSIRPLQVTDHIKIGSGTKTGSYRLICEAVGACIDRNWQGLALTDFIALSAWLRLNSYRETPFSLEWTCTARDHNRDVFTGKVGQETLKNVSVFNKNDLKITPIDEDKLVAITSELAKYNIFCSAPTVADFLFTLESDIMQQTEDAFLFELATSLSPQHGKTLKDRLNFLKQYVGTTDGDTAMTVISLLQQVTDVFEACGVVQTFKVACKHCGEQEEKQVEIDLLTFFPFGK